MHNDESVRGPILRLFEVAARAGCAAELLAKFATVRHVDLSNGWHVE